MNVLRRLRQFFKREQNVYVRIGFPTEVKAEQPKIHHLDDVVPYEVKMGNRMKKV